MEKHYAIDEDEDDACPECRTTRLTKPLIQFRFATCCGLRRCTDCISREFGGRVKEKACNGCSSKVSRKDYDDAPFDRQLYNKEALVRTRAHN
jgi:DNA-directed RNA polymerase subunit RPC12/RpoP